MRLALLVVLLALALPGCRGREGRPLWATVNVCDTAKQPDAIGIRASMPGTPKGARLSMRFRVQYRDGRRRLEGRRGRRLRVGDRRRRAGTAVGVGLELHLRAPGEDRPCCAASCGSAGAAGHAAAPGRGGHRGRPPLQRGRRPGGLLGRDLRARQLSEQPRVVGDDPGHAELLEPADPRAVVDGPDVELPAGSRTARTRRGETSRQWAISASQRPAACGRAPARQLRSQVAAPA